MKTVWRIAILKHIPGYEPELEEIREFDTKQLADDALNEFSGKSTSGVYSAYGPVEAQVATEEPEKRWYVKVWEHEAGWGSKPDDTQFFHTREQALDFMARSDEHSRDSHKRGIWWTVDGPHKL